MVVSPCEGATCLNPLSRGKSKEGSAWLTVSVLRSDISYTRCPTSSEKLSFFEHAIEKIGRLIVANRSERSEVCITYRGVAIQIRHYEWFYMADLFF